MIPIIWHDMPYDWSPAETIHDECYIQHTCGFRTEIPGTASLHRAMISRQAALTFTVGLLFGLALNHGTSYTFPKTLAPTKLSEIPVTGVSHNPEIQKQVLASYNQLPHVTQIAKSVLKPGQIASENWHRDMAELFLFIEGNGILRLDRTNHSIVSGTVAAVYPPTKHTIFNSGSSDLVLFSVASVP